MRKSPFVKNVSITTLTQLMVGLSSVILLTLITRNYGVDAYGQFYVLRRAIELLWVLSLLGLTISIPRNKHFIEKENKGGIEKGLAILFPLLLLGVYVLASKTSMIVLGSLDEVYKTQFIILVISYAIIGLVYAYFRGESHFVRANSLQIIGYFLLPMVPLFLSSNLNEYFHLYSIISIIFSTALLFVMYVIFFIPAYLKYDQSHATVKQIFELLTYGIKRLPGIIGAIMIFNIPILALNHFSTPHEIGVMSQLLQMIAVINLPVSSLGLVILPVLSKKISDDKKNVARENIKLLYNIFGRVGFIIIIGTMIFSSEILTVLTGKIVTLNLYDHLFLLFGMYVIIYHLLRNPIDAVSKKAHTTRIILYVFLMAFITLFILRHFYSIETVIKFTILLSYSAIGFLSIVVCSKLYKINVRYRNIFLMILLNVTLCSILLYIKDVVGFIATLCLFMIMISVWLFLDRWFINFIKTLFASKKFTEG